jgi:hypothetical protein
MRVAMQKEEDHYQELDKKLAAVCGLYCEACSWFIATNEDHERLKRLAAQLHFWFFSQLVVESLVDFQCKVA